MRLPHLHVDHMTAAASIRAAAAITSITMNDGTSLRADAVQEAFSAVSECGVVHRNLLFARAAAEFGFRTGCRPRLAVFGGLL